MNRIIQIDALRGLALLGILMVNAIFFLNPYIINWDIVSTQSLFDQVLYKLITIFADGKFYPLFSILFGFGVFTQLDNLRSKHQKPGKYLLIRLFLLSVFGIVHFVFLWYGDILLTYSILGLFLLVFRNVNTRALKNFGISFIAISTLLSFCFVVLTVFASLISDISIFNISNYQSFITIYGSGNVIEIFIQRISDYILNSGSGLLVYGPQILGLFLIGAYFARTNLFRDVQVNIKTYKSFLVLGLLGVCLNTISVLFIPENAIGESFKLIITIVFGPMQTLGYIALFMLISTLEIKNSLIRVMAAVGKLSLTNYLIQSLLFTFISYSYGLGLYGKLSIGQGLLIALAVYIFNIIFSNIWLLKFKYGPLEFVWRKLNEILIKVT
jgi:uncharacterized protein